MYLELKGILKFNPEDKTKKHKDQASWKKMALVLFDGEICEYYSWFIEKRYGLKLNRPLRGAHISFINDSTRDIRAGFKSEDDAYVEYIWKDRTEFFDGREINVKLDPDVRSDGRAWWMVVPEEEREDLHFIRKTVGLDRPFFGLHMSLGFAKPSDEAYSKKLVETISKYGGSYN